MGKKWPKLSGLYVHIERERALTIQVCVCVSDSQKIAISFGNKVKTYYGYIHTRIDSKNEHIDTL